MKSSFCSANYVVKTLTMLVFSICLAGLALPTWADDNDDNGPDPSTRVARISYLQGNVSLQIGHSDEWINARLNRPLTNRDQLWTDSGSRAELQIGMATIHLDQNTQLGIMELSDKVLQVRLNQGVLNIAVRGMDNDDTVEIDTPNASVTIPEPGSYRIEVSDHDDVTIVQVRDGSAEVAGERQRYTVKENEQLRLRGSGRLNAQFDDLDHMDDFDRWVSSRNSRARNATAARYVDANVIGYEDLDDYGYWRWEAGFGNVWYPNTVVRGWSHYRYGHWEWIGPWGWTWIDDAAWGFAPFHYGRWTEVHHRWCWVPGRREIRAVYAPALVAWMGTPGASMSVTVGGSVGWIPLGPREIFRPHYRASGVYLSRVNVSNSLLDREEYDRMRRLTPRDHDFVNRGAVSVIPATTFTSAGNVHRNLLPIGPRDLRPLDTLERFRPDRSAVIGGARVISPPSRVIDREVVVQR
ncbi:MAG: FecR domain-containing protein, partial [Polaromonas sp.]|nr:FecR domain-containing protein [Polaromonas sp.]